MISCLVTTRLNLNGVSDSEPVVQQSSVLECWCFYKKYEKTILMGIISKCLCPAPEVTVRDIYSHPGPEVLGEYF